jgi:putative two-component system response regulator
MNIARFRVLLVEDNLQDARLIQQILKRYRLAQFEVGCAGTTTECDLLVRLEPPDIVLLDHGLPGENGLSFLRRFSLMPHMPPVILLTGNDDESMAVESIRLGAYDFYPKNAIDSETLGRVVHLTVERYRLDRALQRGNEQVIFALADAVDSKDSVTGGHLLRLEAYADRLGRHLGLPEHDLMILQYGAILHDIGKISVNESILSKPADLTEQEWVEMRKHPLTGERICAPLRFSDEISRVIRHHHERWDGKGYVDGLAGEEIPLLARVISIVDSFDAMTSDRPYRKSIGLEAAIDQLKIEAGTQWDPNLVAAFLEIARNAHREINLSRELAQRIAAGQTAAA